MRHWEVPPAPFPGLGCGWQCLQPVPSGQSSFISYICNSAQATFLFKEEQSLTLQTRVSNTTPLISGAQLLSPGWWGSRSSRSGRLGPSGRRLRLTAQRTTRSSAQELEGPSRTRPQMLKLRMQKACGFPPKRQPCRKPTPRHLPPPPPAPPTWGPPAPPKASPSPGLPVSFAAGALGALLWGAGCC